ncbi:MAG: Asp-tRNA(Asn)/Glu-tRNA(Gln) amidotransferase subunit GatC [Elusimicrobia bacterium]|nr:Asp-tRNA(Asn)/Glu-tRNA(Gln) amidotransferase subunit GatC [Elusimicrobiota bacterium]
MSITAEEVRRIAALARLRLSDEEAALYEGQFGRILELVAEISALDTSQTAATTSVLGLSNVMRDDVPKPFCEPERLLALAPESEGGYYKVKKVLA